eukprot:m.982049 g.982049  ORF g.982049 m.982049 type:complete len:146 (+) comp23972_c0_seq60:309-746(+)
MSSYTCATELIAGKRPQRMVMIHYCVFPVWNMLSSCDGRRTKFFTQTLVNVQGAKSVRRNGRDIHLFNKVLRHPYFQSLKWETFSPDVVYAGPLDDVHTATKMLIVHVADQKDKMELLVCVIISYLTLPNGTEPRSARSSEYGVL